MSCARFKTHPGDQTTLRSSRLDRHSQSPRDPEPRTLTSKTWLEPPWEDLSEDLDHVDWRLWEHGVVVTDWATGSSPSLVGMTLLHPLPFTSSSQTTALKSSLSHLYSCEALSIQTSLELSFTASYHTIKLISSSNPLLIDSPNEPCVKFFF